MTLLVFVLVLGLAASGAGAQEPAPVQPDHSTLLLWRFDEGEGETAADSSPAGRLAGKVTGARWVDGRFGKALAWGRENGTVQVKGDFSALKDAFTLQAWVRLEELPTGKSPFWAADVAGRLGSCLMTIRPPGVLYVGVQLGNLPNYLTGHTRIETGKWTHVALVYDGAAGKIATFVDGKIDLEADVAPGSPREVNDSGNPVFIRSYGGGDEKLVGAIDEVSLSAKAITFGYRWHVPVFLHLLRYSSEFLVAARLSGGAEGPIKALRVTLTGAEGKRILDRRIPAAEVGTGVVLPVPGLQTGVYQARAVAIRADGDEDVVLERDVRYTPPDGKVVSLRPDGACLVRGKPFFPLGLYHVRQSDLKLVTEGGFNLAMSQPPAVIYPAGDTRPGDGVGFIEACAGLGLMSVGKGGVYHNRETAAPLFAHYRGDPNILFWYAYDEPGSRVPLERTLATYDEWAAADPTHPIFLLDNIPGQFLRHAQACDVFATDPYPIRKDDNPRLEHVTEYTRAAVQAVFGGKPVWVALQAYTVKAVSEAGKSRDGIPRLATPEELRCMAYLALAAGARGLLFYAFDDTYYNNGVIRGVNLAAECPEFWGHLRVLAAELKGHTEVWTAPYSSLRPENRTPAVTVQERPYEVGGRTYLLAVNPTRAEQPLRIRLPGARKGSTVQDALGGKPLRLTGDVLEDTLGPRQPRCYVVEEMR